MATSTQTGNYGLSQYAAGDPVKILTNYNNDMAKIDTAIKAAKDSADAKAAIESGGLWTPTLYGYNTAGSPVFAVSNNKWYRIGGLIFIQCEIYLSSLGGMAGPIMIGGLPFAAVGYNAVSFAICDNLQLSSGHTLLHLDISNNNSAGTATVGNGNGGYDWLDAAELKDTTILRLSGVYRGA